MGIDQTGYVAVCSNLRAIIVDQEPSSCKLVLVGQTPETVLNSALASIGFYLQQKELLYQRTEEQLKRKLSKVEAAAKRKLQEIHNAYNEVSLLRARSRYARPQTMRIVAAPVHLELAQLQDVRCQAVPQICCWSPCVLPLRQVPMLAGKKTVS